MIKCLSGRAWSLATVAILLSACVNTSEIELNESIPEDSDYAKVYTEFTRSAEIYRDFESRYRMTATYLSPKFRGAFTKRLKDLFTQEHPSLEEAGKNAGFFVSIQSPDENEIDLNDPHLWTIFMDIGDGHYAPILIKRVQQKERWNPFFASISKWSREYLIIFDTGAVSPNSPDLVEKSSIRLTFANSEAKVKMHW